MWPFRRRLPVLCEVMVNTTTGRVFSGVIWQRRDDYLVLRNGSLLEAGGKVIKLDGETLIPEEIVDFIQAKS